MSAAFFQIGFLLIIIECYFDVYITNIIKYLNFPVILWPSEVWFLLIGGFMFFLKLNVRDFKLNVGDTLPFVFYFSVMLFSLLHGLLANNFYALRDFRELCFGIFVLPIILTLAPFLNLKIFFYKLKKMFLILSIFYMLTGISIGKNTFFSELASNTFCTLLLFIFPLLFLLTAFKYKNHSVFLIILSFGILLNFSKANVANFLFFIILTTISFFLLSHKPKFPNVSKIRLYFSFKIILILSIVIMLIVSYNTYTNGSIVDIIYYTFFKFRVSDSGNFYTGNLSGGRFEMWLASLKLWLEKPFFGHGLGKILSVYSSGWHEKFQLHNYYIQILQNTGFIGTSIILISFIYWLVKVLNRIFTLTNLHEKIMYCTLFNFVILVLFNGLFAHSLSRPPISLLFWMCIGLLSSITMKKKTVDILH